MNEMFFSELHKDQTIGLVMQNGIEMEYKILDVFNDGIKVLKCDKHIMLIPFTSIKYVRLLNHE